VSAGPGAKEALPAPRCARRSAQSSGPVPTFQSGGQRLLRERLGEVVVHAGREALLAILLHGAGGEGQDGDVTVRPHLGRADRTGRLEAVHLGHLTVHEDEIVGCALEGLDGFPAVAHEIDPVPGLLEHPDGHALAHRVVLGHQDAQRARGTGRGRFG